MTRFGILFVVSLRYFWGTFFRCYFSIKLTSPVFSGLYSVLDENKASLNRGHQPSHDMPGKPRSKDYLVCRQFLHRLDGLFRHRFLARRQQGLNIYLIMFVVFTIECYFVFITI